MNSVLFWLCIGTILYAYFGYPLLLTIFAGIWGKKKTYIGETPTVTLLISAYNEESVIAGKLENCLELDYPKNQLTIMVTADGSDDRTPDIVREFHDRGILLNYIEKRQGKTAAINRAMQRIGSDIVVFSDANNMYDENALRELVLPFSDPRVGAVSGAKSIIKGDSLLGESEGIYWKYESFIKKKETQIGCCTGVAGEIFAVRRQVFESPPDGVINDDFYIAMLIIKKGYQVVYAKDAHSSERISADSKDEMERRARIVGGRYQAILHSHKILSLLRPVVTWQIISHKFLRPLVPLAMAGALLTNVIAVTWVNCDSSQALFHLSPPFNLILIVIQFMFYAVAWIGNRIRLNTSFGKFLFLPCFFVNSNFAAVIGLCRFLLGRQTSLWKKSAAP